MIDFGKLDNVFKSNGKQFGLLLHLEIFFFFNPHLTLILRVFFNASYSFFRQLCIQ